MQRILFPSLLLACVPLPPGETDTDPSTTTESTTSTSSSTTTPGTDDGSTGPGELCEYHCFLISGLNFPYTLDPVDESGNPVGALPVCETISGGSHDFSNESVALIQPECAPGQEAAEVVHELGICNPGPIPMPIPLQWPAWAAGAANALRQECVGRLVNDFDCITDAAGGMGGNGANELCNWFFDNQLQLDLMVSSAVGAGIIEVDSQILPSIFGPCDFEELMCTGGSSSTGG